MLVTIPLCWLSLCALLLIGTTRAQESGKTLALIRGAIKELEACRALLSEPVQGTRGSALSKLKQSHG